MLSGTGKNKSATSQTLQTSVSILDLKFHDSTIRTWAHSSYWANHELLFMPKYSRLKCEAICPIAEALLKLDHATGQRFPSTAENLQQTTWKWKKQGAAVAQSKSRPQCCGGTLKVHKQTTANLNELKHCCEEEGAKIPPKQQLFQVLKVVLQDTKSWRVVNFHRSA